MRLGEHTLVDGEAVLEDLVVELRGEVLDPLGEGFVGARWEGRGERGHGAIGNGV